MPRKRLSVIKKSFYQGIIAALALVHLHDQETLFREIVATVDEAELLQAASYEDMEWCGLKDYGYSKRRKVQHAAK